MRAASMESPQKGDLIKILLLMLKLMLILMVTLRVLFLFKLLVAERAGKKLCVVVPDVDVDVEGEGESVFFQTHGCAQKSRRRPLFRAGGLSPSS